MSGWREVPGTPYRSEREQRFEENQRRKRIERAIQQSDVLRRMETERAEKKACEKVLYCLWAMADADLRRAEKLRDSHAPADRETVWDPDFCEAIQQIPEKKQFCEWLWSLWLNAGRPEYYDWL